VKPYYFGQVHGVTCWMAHDDCALRAAANYLSARIEHDRGRLHLLREASSFAMTLRCEKRTVALEVARAILTASHDTDWKREETA
jgi:hypothetical protein